MEKEHISEVDNGLHMGDDCFIYALACSPIKNTILSDQDYELIESWFSETISEKDLYKAKELIKNSTNAKQHVLDLRIMLAANDSPPAPTFVSQNILQKYSTSKSNSYPDILASIFPSIFSFQVAAAFAVIVCAIYAANQYSTINHEIPNNSYATNTNNTPTPQLNQAVKPPTEIAENNHLKENSNERYDIAMADITIPTDTITSYSTVTRGAKLKYIPKIKQISVSSLVNIAKYTNESPSSINEFDHNEILSQFMRENFGMLLLDTKFIIVDRALFVQARKVLDNRESSTYLNVRLVSEHDPYFKAISKDYPNYDLHQTVFLVEATKFKPQLKDAH